MDTIYLKIGLGTIKKYIDIGVDCVFVATDWAYNDGPIYSPDFMRKLMILPVKTIADYCHKNGILLLKHTDGNIMKFADEFFCTGINAYQGIEPNDGMDIGLIKQLYGDLVTLMGNVDCGRTLPFGTREEIIAEAKACIRAAARGGGFILSRSNTITYPTTKSSFLLMLETAKKYGSYPLDFKPDSMY